MSIPHRFTIRSPESVDELADLEPIIAKIFGSRDRPPGWFQRKLHREVVDPGLSQIARSERGDILGAVLVGAPPSLGKTAQIITLGVLERFRGLGCARELLRATTSAATSRGFLHLTALAESHRKRFYEAAGFAAMLSQRTLVVTTPESPQEPPMPVLELPPAPWDRPRTKAVGGWLEEAWMRTPQAEGRTIAIGTKHPQAWAHISIEGQARLIHRLLLDDRCPPKDYPERVLAVCRALRQAFTPAGPLFLYGLPTVSRITAALLGAGWQNAQESTLMVRSLVLRASLEVAVDRRQGATARVIMTPDRR